MNILEEIQDYIELNGVTMSTEELFIQFQLILEHHEEFNQYLKENNNYKKLSNMNRNKRLLGKRRLFIEWYLKKHQNSKRINEIVNDLSELVFTSTRTIFKDLSNEATD